MELWTDYEGITIDGAFPLKKLLLSEGRSAFFSTANNKGDLTLIRLIACHFDEDEILARWRGVEALSHPGFLKLERYGQLLLDGVTVVYAVFERAEANLSQVVNERRLTTVETTQLAASLSSALQTLHTNGFVHQHVTPSNVFAVGDFVKLRTDCIKETPEGQNGLEAKKQDVHDLALVLLEALTQERSLERIQTSSNRAIGLLPAPFDQIVPKGISGEWGIAEIAAALETKPPARSSARNGTSATHSSASPTAIPVAAPASAVKSTSPSATPASSVKAAPSTATPPPTPRASASQVSFDFVPLTGHRVPLQERFLTGTPRSKWIGAAALAALVLILAIWLVARIAHHGSAATASAAAGQSASLASANQSSAVASAHTAASKPSASTSRATAATGARGQWRVVAYTYKRQDQARKKAASVAQKNPALRPEVFSPNGHAPYLVTVGGVMDKDQAFAFAHRARSLGLPRDTYAQNYNVGDR
jgi:hypothetical protein